MIGPWQHWEGDLRTYVQSIDSHDRRYIVEYRMYGRGQFAWFSGAFWGESGIAWTDMKQRRQSQGTDPADWIEKLLPAGNEGCTSGNAPICGWLSVSYSNKSYLFRTLKHDPGEFIKSTIYHFREPCTDPLSRALKTCNTRHSCSLCWSYLWFLHGEDRCVGWKKRNIE